jgi:hypothetical protein
MAAERVIETKLHHNSNIHSRHGESTVISSIFSTGMGDWIAGGSR